MVLPAVIVNCQTESTSGVFICGMYVLCALIRLSYFNVDEEDRQDATSEKRTYYKGLPVTTVALVLPFLFQQTNLMEIKLLVLMIMGVAFLTPFKLKKPNQTLKLILIALGALAFFKVLMGLI